MAAGSLADPGGRGVPVGAAQSGAAPSSTNCCMPKLCPQSWCLERVGCKEGGGLACATSGAGTVAIFNACSWAGTLRCGPSTAHLRATLVERSHIRHTAPQPALPGGIHVSLSYGGWARMATGSVTGKGRSLYIQAPAHPSQPFVSQLKTQDSGRFRASLLLKNPAQLFYCPQAGGSNGPGATF